MLFYRFNSFSCNFLTVQCFVLKWFLLQFLLSLNVYLEREKITKTLSTPIQQCCLIVVISMSGAMVLNRRLKMAEIHPCMRVANLFPITIPTSNKNLCQQLVQMCRYYKILRNLTSFNAFHDTVESCTTWWDGFTSPGRPRLTAFGENSLKFYCEIPRLFLWNLHMLSPGFPFIHHNPLLQPG